MIRFETKTRIRYPECDRMGFCYHGNYAQFFEMARVEFMRSRGLTYREIEERGYMLPVLQMDTKFHKPAYYDDEITVVLKMHKKPSIRLYFEFEVLRGEETLVTAEMALAFMSAETKRASRMPDFFAEVFTDDLLE